MNIARFVAAFAGILMLAFGHAASAQQLEFPFIGNWVDRMPDGTAMVTMISPYTVSFMAVNKNGDSNGPATTIQISASKYSEDVYMLTPTGALGEPMAIKVKDANTIYLQFKDRVPRTLRRQVEEQSDTPAHGHK